MESSERGDSIELERRSVLTAAAGGLAAGAFGVSQMGGVAAQSDETVTIIHDTHFHGRFRDSGDPEKDIVRYHAMVEELRESHENSVFLGNGDDLAPSVLGLEYEGEHVIEAMNHMDIDAVGAGNHEFDFGVDTAVDRFEESEFPWLVANLETPDGEPIPGTERWTTMDVGDVTIGVFGLVVNRFYSITDYPEDYGVIDNVEAAAEATEALREEHDADLVVCAAHISSGRQQAVAEEVDDLDAIVGSHSGITFDEPQIVNGTIISEFGDEFEHLGRLTLDAETGDIVDWERVDFYNSEEEDAPETEFDEHTPVDVHELDGDEELRELVDDYVTDLEERLGEPIVESETELDSTFDNYAIETGWGNTITDLMRDVGSLDRDIQVAVQNAGGIRSNSRFGPGEITGQDVMNSLPFPNEIEVWEISGETLYTYLENQVRPMPGDFGAQPAIQVSGVSFEWTGHDGESEVENVFVGGEPIDADETYLLSTIDFEAGRTVISAEGERVLASGQFQGAYVMDTLESEYETIAPGREHRMVRVDERVETVDVAREDDDIVLTVADTEASAGVVEDSFRLLRPDGETLPAASVEEADDSITVVFNASDVDAFADEGSPEPQLRLLGGFDPDDDHYGYEDDGETVSLPVSSGYEYHKLQAEPEISAVLDALDTSDESDDDDPDGDDDGESDDEGGDDADDSEDETDDTADDTTDDSMDDADDTDDDTDDSPSDDGFGPGFGPFAALAGTGGAAYLLKNRLSDEDESEDV